VLAAEGGYVNNPADPGGETKWGITVAVARANGWTGRMKDLPKSVARDIFLRRYVTEPRFDQVVAVNAAIGAELIDTGVNMGPAVAATFLQRWLNGLNDDGAGRRLYSDLFVDGRLGNLNLRALRAFLARRPTGGAVALLKGLNSVQATRYLEITEAKSTSRKFLFGWITNRVQL
jgi:lysozyme family protein